MNPKAHGPVSRPTALEYTVGWGMISCRWRSGRIKAGTYQLTVVPGPLRAVRQVGDKLEIRDGRDHG